MAVALASAASVTGADAPHAHGEPAMEHHLTRMPHQVCGRLLNVVCLRRSSDGDVDMCCAYACMVDKCWARNCAKLADAEYAQRRAQAATETR